MDHVCRCCIGVASLLLVSLALQIECAAQPFEIRNGVLTEKDPHFSDFAERVHFSQPVIADVRDHAKSAYKADIVSSDNLNATVLKFYHLEKSVVWNQFAHLPISNLTGFAPPQITERSQIGVDPAKLDAHAIQAAGNTISFINNPEKLAMIGTLSPIDLEHRWAPENAPRPWSEGGTAKISLDLKVPVAVVEGQNVGYVQAVLLLRNETGHALWLVYTLFDTRDGGGALDYVMLDGCDQCTGLPIVATLVAPGAKFATPVMGSSVVTNKVHNDYRQYAFTISAGQLQSAIRQIKATYPAAYRDASEDPSTYRVHELALLNEIAKLSAGRALLVSTFRDLQLTSLPGVPAIR